MAAEAIEGRAVVRTVLLPVGVVHVYRFGVLRGRESKTLLFNFFFKIPRFVMHPNVFSLSPIT